MLIQTLMRTAVDVITAAAMLTSVAASAAEVEELYPELTPNPGLAASEVVQIQLDALANNDTPRPDAGIEITFRFASPGNRAMTGPLPRFIALVKNPVYGPMINHVEADYGPSRTKDGREMISVLLTTRDGGKAAYVFIVGQQNVEGCEGCWMTEGVYRVRIDESNPGSNTATGLGV